jgi:Putative Ig domain/Beta-propeller repeat
MTRKCGEILRGESWAQGLLIPLLALLLVLGAGFRSARWPQKKSRAAEASRSHLVPLAVGKRQMEFSSHAVPVARPASPRAKTEQESIAKQNALGLSTAAPDSPLSTHPPQGTSHGGSLSAHRSLAANYGRLPLSFEINEGQSDQQVKYLAHAPGYTLFLTNQEAVLSLPAGPPARASAHAGSVIPQISGRRREAAHAAQDGREVQLRFLGAKTPTAIAGRDPLPGKSNYFIGNDPKQWHTNVPNYSAVEYRGIYSGVDAVFHGDNQRLEFDFDIAPGADPHTIALEVDGARQIRLDRTGDLLLRMDARRNLIMARPHIYQQSPQGRREIAGHYVLGARNRIAFALDPYDRTRPLVIDPTVEYATYLGGSNYDYADGVAVDTSGNTYIAGFTSSTNFPILNGYQTTCGDCTGGQYLGEGFITKLNPSGTALVYSTYLSGAGGIYAIAVDSSGSAYVAGSAGSPPASGAPGLPTVNAFQASNHGTVDNAFVTKLSPDGSSLVYSTFLGGAYFDEAFGIAVDSSGSAYVTGLTNSFDFPTVNPIQASCNDCAGSTGSLFDGDAFVTKFSPDGSSLVYSTYLGGSAQDWGESIAVDSSGSAYLTGITQSTNFPTANPFQAANASTALATSGANAFVTKLNPAGSALTYSTYLGGAAEDYGIGIAVDSAGSAYVTGFAQSHNFPTKNPYQALLLGENDAFVTKFNADGTALVYSTYLGGQSATQGGSIAVDAFGNAYVTGSTTSNYFPIVDATQADCLSCSTYSSAFVSQFNATGSSLLFSTYLGGSSDTIGYGIAVDPSGNAHVAGLTASTNFPTVAPFQATNKSTYGTAFAAMYSFPTATTLTLSPATIPSGAIGVAYSPVTIAATGATGTVTFAVTSGALPSGITLTTAGVLSGTPTQGGSFPFTVTAADTSGDSGSQAYSLQIACETITVSPTALNPGIEGTAYPAVTFTETGGVGTTTLSETGALPTGITFAAPVLSGTPTQTGSFPFEVTATDSNSCTGSSSLTLTITGSVPSNSLTINETVHTTDTPLPPGSSVNGMTSLPVIAQNINVTDTPLLPGSTVNGMTSLPVIEEPIKVSDTPLLPGSTVNGITSLPDIAENITVSDIPSLKNQTPPPPPSLKFAADPDSLTIDQGQTGMTALTFTPAGGYAATLGLSCSGLPEYSLCSFSENGATVSSVTLTGNDQPVNVELSLETDVRSAQAGTDSAAPRPDAILPAFAFWWSGGLLGLAAFTRRPKMSRKNQRRSGLCLLLLLTVAAAAGLAGCGGNGSGSTSYVTPVGTSTVTISATPGSGAAQTLSISVTIAQ